MINHLKERFVHKSDITTFLKKVPVRAKVDFQWITIEMLVCFSHKAIVVLEICFPSYIYELYGIIYEALKITKGWLNDYTILIFGWIVPLSELDGWMDG